MDSLGRYYTQNTFSNLLVSNMKSQKPKKILELGAGRGALLTAASRKWSKAKLYATDIDIKSVKALVSSMPNANIFNISALDSNLPNKISLRKSSVDVAVCNPPYLKMKSNHDFSRTFNDANLTGSLMLPFLTSDIVFLAQNISLLKHLGELAIILPDSVITGHNFIKLRQDLLSNHSVQKIIQLPENIYPKTEALTHILYLEKGATTSNNIEIFSVDVNGKYNGCINVLSSSLEFRMDYKYHSYLSKQRKEKSNKLSDYNPVIKRGNITNKELKKIKIPQLHTTSIKHGVKHLSIDKKIPKEDKTKYVFAEYGDILLARVGRGCMGKTSKVGRGKAVISDCLYRIRVEPKYRKAVFESLISSEGQEWLRSVSHGVCAKVLSKKDLLNFPINKG